MRASDVMTRRVVCVHPATTVADAAKLMIRHRVGGLPVVDGDEQLVGIVTESDLLYRPENGADRRDRNWLTLVVAPDALAQDYAAAPMRAVGEVMTPAIYSVGPNASLTSVVDLMEAHHVKRLPVVVNGKVTGIISRADLLKAMSHIALMATQPSDEQIRTLLLAQFDRQEWAAATCIDADVRKGIVTLRGIVFDGIDREALQVMAANVTGVRGVEDKLIWIDDASLPGGVERFDSLEGLAGPHAPA